MDAIQLPDAPPTGIAVAELLRTAIGCGPYPAMSWIRACERIRLELVLMLGIRALVRRFPFNNYALQFHDLDTSRVDFMARTESDLLVGTALGADAVSLRARRKNAFHRLRHFAPEAQTRVVLLDVSVTPIPYTPGLQPGEMIGLVDIQSSQARFIDG